jgi:hypothetical protein
MHIAGVLSIPRASLNGWIYLPEELALQDAKAVPMFFEHEEIFNPNATPIGRMSVFWNPDLLQLNYEAVVTDKEKIQLIKSGEYKHVSMGATWEDFDLIRGWLFPKGTEIIEGSLVKFPGIPEATVNIIDHVMPKMSESIRHKQFDSFTKCEFNHGQSLIDARPDAIIPTKECSLDFCYSILNASHKADGVNASACDKHMSKEEKQDSEEREESHDDQTLNADGNNDSNNKQNIAEEKKIIASDGAADAEKDGENERNAKNEKKKLVVIDTNSMKLLLRENSKMVIDSLKEVVSPIQKVLNALPKPQPTALVSDGVANNEVAKKKFYDAINKAFKMLPNSNLKSLDWEFISQELKKDGIAVDALTTTSLGSAAGKQWLEDITVIPAGLAAGIRNTCEAVMIERGAEEAIFTLITTPDPVDGTEATAPSDVSQAISTVTAKPVERVIKQTVSDQAIRKTPTNLSESLALSYRQRELLDEDDKILTELNAITVGNLAADIFGGNATAENQIDSGDTFTANLLAKAKRAIARKGWSQALIPSGLVCVMSPEQHEQLITDAGITRFVETVNEGNQLREGILQRVHGVDIFVSSKVPTGSGAGTPAVTTHRAFVYVRQVAMGLAFTKELAIETDRDISKRATEVVATWELAAKNKRADAVARIVTYGSG